MADYYSHTAFESPVINWEPRPPSVVVAADGLIGRLGGPQTPAIGWALGMERLLLVLEAAAQADLGVSLLG